MNWITIQYLKSIFYQCYDCFKTVYLWGEIVAFASLSWFAFKLFLQFALIACKCKIVLLKILNALNDLFLFTSTFIFPSCCLIRNFLKLSCLDQIILQGFLPQCYQLSKDPYQWLPF